MLLPFSIKISLPYFDVLHKSRQDVKS